MDWLPIWKARTHTLSSDLINHAPYTRAMHRHCGYCLELYVVSVGDDEEDEETDEEQD